MNKKQPVVTPPVVNLERYEEFKVKISQLVPFDLNFGNMTLTEYELLVMTIYRLNELIGIVNMYSTTIDEVLEWVTNEGIPESVLKQLNVWLNDGTLRVLINETLFNTKLDKIEFESYKLLTYQNLEDLDNEIDNITTQMSQKADKGNVSVSDINKNLGKFDQTYMSDDFLQQMAGNAPISAVPANRSLTSEKYALKSITPIVTDFILTSTNLFDVTKLETGLLSSSGEYTSASDYLYLPDGIPCEPSTTYSHVGITNISYFTASGEFIKRATVVSTPSFTTPPNAFLMIPDTRTYLDLSTIQLNEGDNLLSYEPFYKKIDEDIKLANNTIDSDMLKEKSVSYNKTDFIVQNKANLLDSSQMRLGYYNSEGSYTHSSTYITNDTDYFIEVEPNTNYTMPVDNASTGNSSVFLWYTDEKVLIQRDLGTSAYFRLIQGFTSESPSNAKFLKINLATHFNINIENACVFKGDRLLNLYEFIGNFDDPKREITKNYKFSISKTFGNFPEVELPEVGSVDSPFSSKSALHDEVYEVFDDLMNENLSYISRNEIGTSTLGKPIYEYYFSPESGAITSGHDSPYPTIILISSVHGGEDLATYTLYHVMDMIASKWAESDKLEYLRHYVNIRVVPLPNPDDFDTRSYIGLNDINLNRDFDINWKVQTGAHTAPNQRVESTIMQDYLKNNNDAICFVDCHVRGNPVLNDNKLMWMESLAETDTPIPKDTIETLTRKWKVKYPNLQSVNGQLGYATAEAGGEIGGNGTIDSYGHFVAGVNNILWEGFKASPSITESYGSQVTTMNVQFLGQTILSIVKNYQ